MGRDKRKAKAAHSDSYQYSQNWNPCVCRQANLTSQSDKVKNIFLIISRLNDFSFLKKYF